MKLRSDKSGQVMLATAFLLAIALTFIALMLNNVVYYNNISYTGLMDQGYDDLSIKNIVASEAISAYSEYPHTQSKFDDRMRDLANSLNNGTLPEGSYVVISPPLPSDFHVWDPTGTYQSTKFQLTIYSKGLSKTYTIKTKYSPPVATPIPIPAPTVMDCKVNITSPVNNPIIFQDGTNHTCVTIKVTYPNSSAAEGQQVYVAYNINKGILHIAEDPASDAYDSVNYNKLTDPYGILTLYWYPTSGLAAQGTDVIYASIGTNPNRVIGNLSNNVMITNKKYEPCDHTVTIGAPILQPINNGDKDKINNVWYYYVEYRIPITMPAGTYNFSSFSVGTFLNTLGSSGVYLTNAIFGNYTEPGYVHGPYSDYISVKVYLTNPNPSSSTTFAVNLTTVVNGYCNVHCVPYSTKRTDVVSGTWS